MNLQEAVAITKKGVPLPSELKVDSYDTWVDLYGKYIKAKELVSDVLIAHHPRLLDVLLERERQIMEEGWTPEHDDQHAGGEFADAAACYALVWPHETKSWKDSITHLLISGLRWPWDFKWWKPGSRERNLIKAQALLLAEQERLDRAFKGEVGNAR